MSNWTNEGRNALAASKPNHPTCAWADDADGNWDTACENKFCFIEGGPTENQMRFCCYCGGRLVVKARREP